MKKALIIMLNDIARFEEIGSSGGKASVEPVFVSTIKHAYEEGFRPFIMVDNTNKSLQFFSNEDLFNGIINQLNVSLKEQLDGIKIHLTYTTYSINKHIMPSPFSLYEMAIKYNVSLRESIMVGGTTDVMETAYNAGIGTYINTIELYEAQG